MIEALGSTPSIEIYLEPQCDLILLHVCGWFFFFLLCSVRLEAAGILLR